MMMHTIHHNHHTVNTLLDILHHHIGGCDELYASSHAQNGHGCYWQQDKMNTTKHSVATVHIFCVWGWRWCVCLSE